MNIAFISYWSCPLTRLGVLTSGGMNVYVLSLANNLGLLGHKVDIYTRTHREREEKILVINKNVRVIHLSALKKDLYQDTQIFARKMSVFMDKNSLKYDLLHAHYFYSGLVGLKLKTKLAIQLFMTFHALGINKELYAGISDVKRIAAEKKISKTADAIISSVELEKKELVKNYQTEADIFVVPPGVNHQIFKKYDQSFARRKAGMPSRQKTILFVGRIDPIKGITLLIEAVSRLAKTYPNFENNFKVLLIGGDIQSHNFWKHPEVVKIKNLISKLDLSCCVKFIGAKPHHQLPYYYAGSDVVVMPSKYESFGLVVLEAMASGAAVVASEVGGLSSLLKDKVNGRLFKSGDVVNLSKIIWELILDDKQRENLGNNAIISSKNYCWDKQARKIIRIYKKKTDQI